MSSIFTKIILGEIPCYKIAENDYAFSFLDIKPIAKGHALVIPKLEIDNIFDLPDKELTELHLFAKKIARAIQATIPCPKIGMSVIGLEVPHAHIHLVPLHHVSDLNFTLPRLQFSEAEYKDLANLIASNLSR